MSSLFVLTISSFKKCPHGEGPKGCGRVQCLQRASKDLRVIICSVCLRFLSAVGLGMSTPAGS